KNPGSSSQESRIRFTSTEKEKQSILYPINWYQSLFWAMSTPINSYPIPPTFIGVAPLPWLYDCARLCSIHEIPAHDYVDFAWGGLSGAAAMWFDDWGLKRSLESIGWEEFSEAVLCRFGTSTQSSSTYQVFDEIIETRLNFPPATSMAPFVQRFEIGIAESLDLIFQDQYQDPKFALFVESPLRELLVWPFHGWSR
ncbi:hypothetical protein LINGRAPRIM_LOCUS648, partial [Linum grandiflorum]